LRIAMIALNNVDACMKALLIKARMGDVFCIPSWSGHFRCDRTGSDRGTED